MKLNALGVFLIALSSLLLELTLIRVFDILWYPNMAYMVITLAVFSFGLAGVVLAIKPIPKTQRSWQILSASTLVMAICVLGMQPAIDRLPFDYNLLAGKESGQAVVNFFLFLGFSRCSYWQCYFNTFIAQNRYNGLSSSCGWFSTFIVRSF